MNESAWKRTFLEKINQARLCTKMKMMHGVSVEPTQSVKKNRKNSDQHYLILME